MIMLNLFTGVIISSMEEAEQETTNESNSQGISSRGFVTLQEEFAMINDQLQKVSIQLAKLQEQDASREK